MYQKFTDRARKVMQLARQEAQRFNHEYIGTEHILLGLVKEGAGVAANALQKLDINSHTVRQEIERTVYLPDAPTPGGLSEGPRAKKAIAYALEESRALKHDYVGTEHLLLGLLRVQDGVAAQILMNLGLRLEDVRQEVLSLLGNPEPSRPREGRAAEEYDLYLPLRYNDGTAVESEKVEGVKKQLADRFGGLRFFPQRNGGIWKFGNLTFRDEIAILRLLSQDATEARQFLLRLKEELKADLRQEDILIVARRVKIL
jgi:ATP-dependent Clp protease ATP-binding subunit ClpA